MDEIAQNATPGAGDRRLSWKVFGVLMTGALVGTGAVLPYQLSLTELPSPLPVPLWLLLTIGTVQNLLLFGAAAGLGLWLGGKVGLGAPLLRAWLAGDPEAPRRFRASLPTAMGAGVAVGIAILLLEQIVFAPLLADALSDVAAPAPWQGFLASFYGGINEELLTRLGLMTVLVWVATRFVAGHRLHRAVVWSADLVAALLFGAGHLPTLAALIPLTPLIVGRTLFLNGIAGVVFGWLYWRRGLLAAMVAHFSADTVLHVIGAAFA